jgi:hypothetical protein
MSGAPGHTGHTGTTGRRGLQGTPYGPPGTAFYSPSGRITSSTETGATVNIRTVDYGTFYLLSGSRSTAELIFPTTQSSANYGAFWTVRNIYSASKTLTLTNTGGVVYNGLDNVTEIVLTPDKSITFVFSGSSNATSTYIVL